MLNNEYMKQFGMSYGELSKYLQDKYGKTNGNYFLTESCSSPNSSIKRVSEGLYIHHIAEYHDDYDMIDNLSQKDKAKKFPFLFQTPEWLCYCNYIEHIILHYHIYNLRTVSLGCTLDDGLVHFLLPELKEWYRTKGSVVRGTWRESAYNAVRDDESTFQYIYRRFYSEHPQAPKYSYNEYYNAQKNHKLQRPNPF